MRIDEALTDRNLLGASLDDVVTWRSWLTVLKAAKGQPLSDEEAAFLASVSGDRQAPAAPVRELWAVIGRRSGKSRVAAGLAVFEATLRQHRLAAGETGVVLVLAATLGQASVVFRYCLGFLEASPLLRQQIVSATANEIRLDGGVMIAVYTSNFRTVRGRTVLAAIFDEVAFWQDDSSANPDREVLRAVQPALAASGGPLIAISSPYRKTGLLFDRHRVYFGTDDARILVVQGPSSAFNPTLEQATIEQAHADDPESASSEWDAEFRSDIAGFLDDELIEAATDSMRPRELPPIKGRSYVAACDPSGGRADSMTLCIGHKEKDGEHGERFIVDVIRGVGPPFNPQAVTAEFAALVRDYGVSKVTGDNYSAEWVTQAFRDCGVTYERSEKSASQLYLEALPSFARGAISLPDHAPLIRELRGLERRTSRAGRDQVSHSQGGHDDHSAALCLALRLATKPVTNSARCGFLVGHMAGTIGPNWRRGFSEPPEPYFAPIPQPRSRGIFR